MTVDFYMLSVTLTFALGIASVGGLTYYAARLFSVWYFLQMHDGGEIVAVEGCKCTACGKENTHALQTAEAAAFRRTNAEPPRLRLVNTGTVDMGDTCLREAV
jgi:hypothetical protein